VHEEIAKAVANGDARVYIVWMPMLPGDNHSAAQRAARSFHSLPAAHFYDPERGVGIHFVEQHFQGYMENALTALPDEHPLREQAVELAALPANERPLWDALLFFAPGAEWDEDAPQPQWWTKQIGFDAEAAPGEPSSQFWRGVAAESSLRSSDWFSEVKKGLKFMQSRRGAAQSAPSE